MTADRALVITGINGITEAIEEFCTFDGWDVIFVGDKATPPIDDNDIDDLIYISVDDQESMDSLLVDRLPYGHYTRKNIGYLYAIRHGYSKIAETDDDNIPYEDWDEWIPSLRESDVITAPATPNIYKEFTDEHIWPRGHPLTEITNDADRQLEQRNVDDGDVGVVQGLVDKEPDVDAIYRLTVGDEVTFDERKPVTLDHGVYSPFNSQNTYWPAREILPYLYMPATVSIRLTDILRGYVAQRAMWEHGRHLVFRDSSVYQDRNVHDLMVDFEDEIPVYTQINGIRELLDDLELSENASENIMTIYEALHDADVVAKEELEILDGWLHDIEDSL